MLAGYEELGSEPVSANYKQVSKIIFCVKSEQ